MLHPDGRFAWADVTIPDTEAAAEFYTELFGWKALAVPGGESMPYTMFLLGDRPVAGMAPLRPEDAAAGRRPVWSPYVIVADADATARRAKALGATLLMEPMQIADAGKMFFAIDPVGAAIGFWEAGEHAGAGALGVPGAMSWNEPGCRDVDAATAFYTRLLEWGADVQEHGGFAYTVATVDGTANGGIYDATGILPDGVPSFWLAWFTVTDVDEIAALARSLGATVEREPWDTMFGRMSIIGDPQGPVFGIVGTATNDGETDRRTTGSVDGRSPVPREWP